MHSKRLLTAVAMSLACNTVSASAAESQVVIVDPPRWTYVGTTPTDESPTSVFLVVVCTARSTEVGTTSTTEARCKVGSAEDEYRIVPGSFSAAVWAGGTNLPQTVCARGVATMLDLTKHVGESCVVIPAP